MKKTTKAPKRATKAKSQLQDDFQLNSKVSDNYVGYVSIGTIIFNVSWSSFNIKGSSYELLKYLTDINVPSYENGPLFVGRLKNICVNVFSDFVCIAGDLAEFYTGCKKEPLSFFDIPKALERLSNCLNFDLDMDDLLLDGLDIKGTVFTRDYQMSYIKEFDRYQLFKLFDYDVNFSMMCNKGFYCRTIDQWKSEFISFTTSVTESESKCSSCSPKMGSFSISVNNVQMANELDEKISEISETACMEQPFSNDDEIW
jgi:hypothetical protein